MVNLPLMVVEPLIREVIMVVITMIPFDIHTIQIRLVGILPFIKEITENFVGIIASIEDGISSVSYRILSSCHPFVFEDIAKDVLVSIYEIVVLFG